VLPQSAYTCSYGEIGCQIGFGIEMLLVLDWQGDTCA